MSIITNSFRRNVQEGLLLMALGNNASTMNYTLLNELRDELNEG